MPMSGYEYIKISISLIPYEIMKEYNLWGMAHNGYVYCDIQPPVNDKCPSFFGFHRKLAHTKPQQSTDKASKHNGRTVFSRVLVLLTRSWTGVASTLSYCLYPLFVLLPHNLHQLLPFLPLPLPEYAVTDRVCLYPRFGWACKSIWPHHHLIAKEADTTMMTYPFTADLSANHCTSGDTSIILPHRLQQRPPPPPTLEIIFQVLTVSGINNVF